MSRGAGPAAPSSVHTTDPGGRRPADRPDATPDRTANVAVGSDRTDCDSLTLPWTLRVDSGCGSPLPGARHQLSALSRAAGESRGPMRGAAPGRSSDA